MDILYSEEVSCNGFNDGKIELNNVSNSTDYNFLEFYADNQSSSSLAMEIFYCNSSYLTGNVLTSESCHNFYDLEASDVWNHSHGANSKHYMIPFPIASNKINDVLVTKDSMAFLGSIFLIPLAELQPALWLSRFYFYLEI